MKNSLFIFLALTALATFPSCNKVTGEGPLVVETRQVTNFSAVQLSVPGDLYFTQSNTFKVEIEAQRNILDVIESFLVNGTELRLKMKNNTNIRRHEPIRIFVSAPSINHLSLSGSGNIKVTQPIQATDMRLSVSGSGNLDLSRLFANNVTAVLSGSGNIYVRDGDANESSSNVSGSGNIDMLDFKTKRAEAVLSGSGSVRLYVTDDLEARISGSGEILYKGNPVIHSQISGSGRVVKY